jgi:hypothetical protein
MQVLKSDDDIGEKEFSLFFIEKLAISKMVPQVSSIKVIHNQVKAFSILKCKGHVDKECMM